METMQETIQKELTDISHELAGVLAETEGIPGLGNGAVTEWTRVCRDVERQLGDAAIRVAVVGAIKSGKSTFVNALFGGDYLKRGAGVVTSIVTRIRPGDRLRAVLVFKTWSEINAEIDSALGLMPPDIWPPAEDGFDLRDDDARRRLAETLAGLAPDQVLTEEARNPQIALMTAFLDGYDAIKRIVSDAPVTRRFEDADFPEHRPFAANDHLAVFLDDIRLEIDTGDVPANTEIADCQGSDSPNPHHLAMIEDYLLTAHLIVYVISSRTGLRQADIKFLNIIRRMGMLDHALFVVNADLNEHETADDLARLVKKIREELALVAPEPEVYVFSALLDLLRAPANDPTEKDRGRLAAWEADAPLRDLSDGGSNRFNAEFAGKLTRQRNALLFKSHLERLGVMAAGMIHRIDVNRELTGRSAGGADEMIERIQAHRKKMEGIQAMIRSTLEGASGKLKNQLKSEVDRFFDSRRAAETVGGLLRFIANYNLPGDGAASGEGKTGFHADMYRVYSDFKSAVDRYMAESVNPEIIRFVREAEQKIRAHFETVTGPYDVMLGDVLSEYNRTLTACGIPPVRARREGIEIPDVDRIREKAGVTLPAAEASMRYSARMKSEAMMRFGFFSLLRLFKKLIRKKAGDGTGNRRKALEAGLKRLKADTRDSIHFHFKDYRENLKYQYLFKLVDAATEVLNAALIHRFGAYAGDLSEIARLMGKGQGDSAKLTARIGDIHTALGDIQTRIDRLRQRLDNGDGPAPAAETREET